MRLRLHPLLILLVALPASAWELERLEAGVSFVPPHNEPVIGDMVARYKAEVDASLRFWERVTFDGTVRVWGVQPWRTPEVVGHGFPDAWNGSDWTVTEYRPDYTAALGIDVYRSVQVFVENHIREYNVQSHNYWLTGVKYRMK